MALEEIPDEAERAWILDELAALVAVGGAKRMLEAPIIEPTPEFFPDRWTPGEAGLEQLARRMLMYVGLGDVELEVAAADSAVDGYPIWLEQRDGNKCVLGAAFEDLREDAGGALALAVGSVYRRVRGLAPEVARGASAGYRDQPAPDTEEVVVERKRADLASVYLGLGVLATNHCYRHVRERGTSTYVVARQRPTALAPQSFAYALAIQVAARRLGWRVRHRLVGHLDTNPAAFFAASWHLVADDGEALRKRLRRARRARKRRAGTRS